MQLNSRSSPINQRDLASLMSFMTVVEVDKVDNCGQRNSNWPYWVDDLMRSGQMDDEHEKLARIDAYTGVRGK